MNTREEFEKWMVEEAKIIIGSTDTYPAGLEKDFWKVWQACQLLNDKRIAELEEKLRAAKANAERNRWINPNDKTQARYLPND